MKTQTNPSATTRRIEKCLPAHSVAVLPLAGERSALDSAGPAIGPLRLLQPFCFGGPGGQVEPGDDTEITGGRPSDEEQPLPAAQPKNAVKVKQRGGDRGPTAAESGMQAMNRPVTRPR